MGCNCKQTGQWCTIDHPHDEAEIRMVSESVHLHGPEALKNATTIVAAHNEGCARSQVEAVAGWLKDLKANSPAIFAATIVANAQRDDPEPPDPCQPIPPGTPPEETACREEACIILTLGLAACNTNACRKAWNDWYAAEIAACGQS